MNSRLCLNSLKLVFFMKIHSNTILKPIDCVVLPCKMCSVPDINICSSEGNILTPPETVKGIKKLDKTAFDKQIRLPAVYINVDSDVRNVLVLLKPYILKLLKLKPVLDAQPIDKQGVAANKTILLNPNLVVDFNSFKDIEEKLKEQNITESCFHYVEKTISFENWNVDEIIRAILPNDVSFSGYSIIGHIAHFNLRDELLDYKYVLGEIILDKVKNIRTVVNKVKVIDNTYRNFQMELICGENNTITKLKENACTFEMDFSKVYWNPRLSTEHERIVRMLNSNDVLYDLFAGIGPFVIPAAKKGCLTLANDLNPDAYHWLLHNVKLNKVSRNIECFNCDAKDFIAVHLKKHLLNIVDFKGTDHFKVHVTMNLPALAISFLNDFRGLFTEDEYEKVPKNIICHVYCFIKEENLEKLEAIAISNIAKEFVESHLRQKFSKNLIEIRNVRNVAPNKRMFRISFTFEPEFLIRQSKKRTNEDD